MFLQKPSKCITIIFQKEHPYMSAMDIATHKNKVTKHNTCSGIPSKFKTIICHYIQRTNRWIVFANDY